MTDTAMTSAEMDRTEALCMAAYKDDRACDEHRSILHQAATVINALREESATLKGLLREALPSVADDECYFVAGPNELTPRIRAALGMEATQ